MKVKALTSFAGPVTMFGGETRDITDEKVLNDLVKCGYVEAVEDAKASPPPAQNDDGKSNSEDDGKANANDGSSTEPPAEPEKGKNGKNNK